MINIRQKKKIIEEYKCEIKKMTHPKLLEEWDHVRRDLNPNCTVWDSTEYRIPKLKEYANEKVEEQKKPKAPAHKCAECGYCEQAQRETGRYEYFCRHPKVGEGMSKWENGYDGTICFGKSGTGEMILKTSPKWCPKKKKKEMMQ